MARVDDDVRKHAVAARLEALECDNAAAEPGDDDSDDYVAADDMEGASRVCPQPGVVKHAAHSLSPPPPTPGITSRPKKAKGAKRTTRGQLAERKGPKPLSQLLEEARLDLLPPSDFSAASSILERSASGQGGGGSGGGGLANGGFGNGGSSGGSSGGSISWSGVSGGLSLTSAQLFALVQRALARGAAGAR